MKIDRKADISFFNYIGRTIGKSGIAGTERQLRQVISFNQKIILIAVKFEKLPSIAKNKWYHEGTNPKAWGRLR
ncbi:hypothetical protein DHX103_09710 [Planococcus sp. X10-3]|uniref:hypothetical protein n=1 Tax=Planococcus sp. X10-3 TaxID=3061240 RepID=UPI003BAF80EA